MNARPASPLPCVCRADYRIYQLTWQTKWNGPYVGQVLGSIGEDGLFKLWQEDLAQARQSGRRFKRIIPPISTKSKLPWMSIDFKNINSETYLGLITRDGNLCIMEPRDHDNLSGDWVDWMENRDFYVCPTPSRAQECSFKIVFHKEKLPCWTAVAAGLNRRALSFAVIAMDVVKIYRTDNERRIYIAAILEGAKDLVRDVAWANGSMRGFDIIATASKDGIVRIYELRTDWRAGGEGKEQKEPQQPPVKQDSHGKPSGIGASLAGANRPGDETALEAGSDPSRVKQNVVLVAELKEHKGAVWRCSFSHTGDLLTTSGDDGVIRSWKRGVDMKWRQYAEIDSGTAE